MSRIHYTGNTNFFVERVPGCTYSNIESICACHCGHATQLLCNTDIFCGIIPVAVGLFEASLTSFLIICSSVLEGHPVLANVTVVPYFLHLIITVFFGVSNAFVTFLYLSPD